MSGFVHRAFFYRDVDEWLDGLVPFLRQSVIADEPVLVAVARDRIELLRDAVRADEALVQYVPMEDLGKNPGRLISAWHDFIDSHPSRRLRGIGEPMWPGRRPDEMVECQHHEQLLNVAFEGHELELICPYDLSALAPHVVDEAFLSHPYTGGGSTHRPNPTYALDVTNANVLSSVPAHVQSIDFGVESLRHVRAVVDAEASRLMLGAARATDLVLAVSEAATNSVQHGDGGTLSMWSDDVRLYCQIADGGHLSDPMVGRRRPAHDAPRGRGVWLVHQMCDLVQIRTTDSGTVVRLAMELCQTSTPADLN